MIAELLLALLAAAALTLLLLRERARDQERQEERVERDALLDRIQAPQAAQLAAVQRAVDERPPASDEADDKTYGFDIRPSDDLALVDLIPRSE
jgi:hypothetical protein